MKNVLIAALILTLCAFGCTQKTESETEVDSSGGVTSTHTESTTTPAVDTAATAQATSDAAGAANDAAHETGTAMETAGQAIQQETKTDTNP